MIHLERCRLGLHQVSFTICAFSKILRWISRLELDALQLLGGNGYVNEYPTGRLLRDAKLYEIGAGTQEIRRILIGRELVRD